MAIALTPGYIYFLESDAGSNQNWVAGGATTIDLTTFTEGTEYCKLKLPQRWRKRWSTGIKVTDAGGGSSFDRRASRRGYGMLPESFVTSVANANLIEKFFMIDRHTSGLAATFKDYYMVVIFTASSFAEFISAGSASLNYCPVRALFGDSVWSDATPLVMSVRLNVRSVM